MAWRTASWLASFFHISSASLALASGLIFFVYALALVMGVRFDQIEVPAATPDGADEEGTSDPSHPLRSGFRAMLLPFVVSPLAIAADLEGSLSADGWSGRWVVAGAFTLVALFNALCAVVFAGLLRRAHESVLDVLSRLLGILLAAVGVQLFLQGLEALGAFHSAH